jgi:hypothetical protein
MGTDLSNEVKDGFDGRCNELATVVNALYTQKIEKSGFLVFFAKCIT